MLRIAMTTLSLAAVVLGGQLYGQVVVETAVSGQDRMIYSLSGQEWGGLSSYMPVPMLGGGAHVPSDPMGMLRMPQFEKELELVDHQIEKIRELQQEMQKQTSEIFRNAANVSGDNVGQMMQEAQKVIRERTEEKLAKVLLPHQLQRLNQLKLQMQLRSRGVHAVAGEELAGALGLTDEQKQQLMEKQREAQQKLQERMQQLREQLQQEVIEDVLKPSQLQKLEKLTGEKYEVKKPDYSAMYARPRRSTEEKKK